MDIISEAPDPSSWDLPVARFLSSVGCDLDNSFKDKNVVFSTTFCGGWAGSPDVRSNDGICSALALTCVDHVNSNPGVFEEAYWLVNSVKVYQTSG
jgi:hypothetical protein